uniref:Uncharacterized protein n=1 Tax=Hucho hucho TaxID=62062 RepID=A0A4W5MGK9_9TELE
GTAAIVCRRSAPLGQMPHKEIDYKSLESLEKFGSYTSYLKKAEEAKNTPRVNIGLPHFFVVFPVNVPLDRVRAGWEETSGRTTSRGLRITMGSSKICSPWPTSSALTLRISYNQDSSAQVHYGNRLMPKEAAVAPQVSFVAEKGSLWTLLFTSPDEHLLDSEGECVHWLVGNTRRGPVSIPGPNPCQGYRLSPTYKYHLRSMTPAGLSLFQGWIVLLYRMVGSHKSQDCYRGYGWRSLDQASRGKYSYTSAYSTFCYSLNLIWIKLIYTQ